MIQPILMTPRQAGHAIATCEHIERGLQAAADTAKAARFSASALSTGAFDALPPAQSTIYLPKAPEAAIIGRNSTGIGGMSEREEA
jgi:hypothetical protein